MNWQLIMLNSEEALPQNLVDGFTVGRGDRSHWRVEDDSMSRVHARFEEVGQRFYVIDLHSSNGVYLNGDRVREAEVFPGDRLQLGEKVFQVSGGAETQLRIVEEEGPKLEARLPEAGWQPAGWRSLSRQLCEAMSFLRPSVAMVGVHHVKGIRVNETVSETPVEISSWVLDELERGPLLINKSDQIEGRESLIQRRITSLMAVPLGRGAFLYLESSLELWGEKDLARVRDVVTEFLAVFRPALENWASRERLQAINTLDKTFGKTLAQSRKAALQNVNVVIEGPAGSGKSLLAKWIHEWSYRNDEKFVSVDLSLVPEELIASTLMGHEKGAFTGADEARDGFLREAHRGTLVLENIDESPEKVQTLLLKILEDKEYVRVGGTEKIPLDLRLVVTSRRHLKDLVKEGQFREDLFYRLSVLNVVMPSLDERSIDLENLAEILVNVLSSGQSRKKVKLSKDFLHHLHQKIWPGNIRELRNYLERQLVEQPEATQLESPHSEEGDERFLTLKELEKQHIYNALQRTQWNKGETCQLLGVTRPTLAKKIADYNLRQEG